MENYLNNTLNIGNLGQRTKLREAGFRDMASLVKKDAKFTHYACQSVRKSTTGQAEHKDVTMETEERLGRIPNTGTLSRGQWLSTLLV